MGEIKVVDVLEHGPDSLGVVFVAQLEDGVLSNLEMDINMMARFPLRRSLTENCEVRALSKNGDITRRMMR